MINHVINNSPRQEYNLISHQNQVQWQANGFQLSHPPHTSVSYNVQTTIGSTHWLITVISQLTTAVVFGISNIIHVGLTLKRGLCTMTGVEKLLNNLYSSVMAGDFSSPELAVSHLTFSLHYSTWLQ